MRKGRQLLYLALDMKQRIQEIKWFCPRLHNTGTQASVSSPWTCFTGPAGATWLWAGQNHQCKCGSGCKLQAILPKCQSCLQHPFFFPLSTQLHLAAEMQFPFWRDSELINHCHSSLQTPPLLQGFLITIALHPQPTSVSLMNEIGTRKQGCEVQLSWLESGRTYVQIVTLCLRINEPV